MSVRSPQDGVHTRNELAWIEGLRQVIVSADFESYDPVDVVAAGGQHQDRNLGLSTELPQNFEPVETREHHVENHESVAPGKGFMKACIAFVGKFEREILAGEEFAEEFAKLSIVIDDQDAPHRSSAFCFSAWLAIGVGGVDDVWRIHFGFHVSGFLEKACPQEGRHTGGDKQAGVLTS